MKTIPAQVDARMHRKLFRLLLPVIMLVLSAGACYFVEDMGELYVDQPAAVFKVHGDTEQSWGVKVIPGAHYKVSTTPEQHGVIAPLQFYVSSQRSECDNKTACLASTHNAGSSRDPVTLTFTAPDTYKVYVLVYWVAESGDHLGEATIQIQNITPRSP